MMDRPLGIDPGPTQRPRRSGWLVLGLVAAVLIVGGLLFYNTRARSPDQTASNRPAVIQTNPSGPERTTPVPPPTSGR